ncbi:MAG TPA: phosphatase PAP2 family protein [Candidatus Rifleibacterium sp.]|nr:phosphatase PAP2 family protein [Candidatus Rifleibacterium sp.]HPT45426.1 phosphatase PAP2 family protein [Candidatus Rifleibacterium sp.]
MLETLVAFDHKLFMLLNSSLINGFLDWFMPFITNAKTWLPIVLLLWLLMIAGSGKRLRVLALALLVAVGFTDLFCARVIKPAVARTRPCSVEPSAGFTCRLLLPKKNSRSFPSNHAANTAAFAVVTLMICGLKAGMPLAFLAFLVGWSRVYVGVHFPLDVLCGWLVGAIFAWLVSLCIIRWFPPDNLEIPVAPEKPGEV